MESNNNNNNNRVVRRWKNQHHQNQQHFQRLFSNRLKRDKTCWKWAKLTFATVFLSVALTVTLGFVIHLNIQFMTSLKPKQQEQEQQQFSDIFSLNQEEKTTLNPSANSLEMGNGNSNKNDPGKTPDTLKEEQEQQIFKADSQDGDTEFLKQRFQEAGIQLTEQDLQELPSWKDIVKTIGPHPIVYGLDRCEAFRQAVPAVTRNIGCGGMFNSGTNLVTRLLKENCKIPERIEFYGWKPDFDKWGMGPGDAHGIRWQVPWGKHTAARYREQHSTDKASKISKESVLPVVTIRHPYSWFKSMCRRPYTAKWPHNRFCPHLVDRRNKTIPVTVRYGDFEDSFESLADLYNGWYQQYVSQASYPRLVVRFEDLIFHTKNVTQQICACAGGIIRTDRPFYHIVKSAKEGPGHGRKDQRTGFFQAFKQNGKPLEKMGGFTSVDYQSSLRLLDHDLMKMFGYQHPPP